MKKYSPTQFASGYVQHLLAAKGRHGIHSPFVFKLYNEVVLDDSKEALDKVDRLIDLRKKQNTVIHYQHPAFEDQTVTTSIRKIANSASHPRKIKRLLCRLANYVSTKQGLEIGTSLGFTSMYLAASNPNSDWVTVEGAEQVAKLAQQSFKDAGLNNIRSMVGNFDDILPNVLDEINEPLDFIFFDGNHQYTPTLSYFEQCLKYRSSNAVFVFDDINWSPGMQDAWRKIQAHPEVVTTVDLYFMGLVFFDRSRSKEHFKLRF